MQKKNLRFALIQAAQILVLFWQRHPACFYGVSFFLGASLYFYSFSLVLFSLCVMLFPFFILRSSFISLLCFVLGVSGGYFYSNSCYCLPELPKEGLTGKALIEVKTVQLQQSFFGQRWSVRGVIKAFHEGHSLKKTAKNIPFSAYFKEESLASGKSYWIEGNLKKESGYTYFFRANQKEPLKEIQENSFFATHRPSWKKAVSDWIHQKISDSQSALFLSGLVTGEFDDEWIREQFSRFGLQHLLAVSGFHFSVLISFLFFFFSFFGRRASHLFVMFFMSAYFVFLGAQPSVLRAWIMSFLACTSYLIEKNPRPLNLFGASLLFSVAFDPFFITSLGFQLSFGITASILLFQKKAKMITGLFLTKRSFKTVLNMNWQNQMGYCLLLFLRETFALSAAVNITALPLSLYFFEQFSLTGIIYNLFFPCFAGFSIFLLLIGIFLPFSDWLYSFNSLLTKFFLGLVAEAPKQIDFHFYFFIPKEMIALSMTIIITGGILLSSEIEESFAK